MLVVICILQLSTAYANQEYQHVLTLESPFPENHAWFGYSVKICGDIIIISEPYANVDDINHAGKVYVYDAAGNLISTLQSPTPGYSNNFGEEIDILSEVIIVGEYYDSDNLRDAGKAYTFTINGTLIHSIESLKPRQGGYFGCHSVSMGHGLLVISEINAETSPGSAGKVHLYDEEGNYLKSLLSPTPILYGSFGATIEVGEGMILVGQYGRVGSNKPRGPGSVYVFDYEGNHLMTLQAPEPEDQACFGRSISISGDRIVVGEMWATVEGVWQAGRAYIFNTDGEILHTLQSPNLKEGARFGEYLAIDGDRLVVGEWDADVNSGQYEGRAYVYDVDGNLLQNLTAPYPCPRAAFGFGVDIDGDTIVVGECWAATKELGQAGRVHVYRLGPSVEAQEPAEETAIVIEEEPETDDTGGGIPGFPVAVFILGLIATTLYFTRRNR